MKQVCGCDLLLQQTVDTQEPYPFVTFSIVTPEQDTTTDWLGDGRQYVCTFQIDVHAGQPFTANDMARKLYEALHDRGYRRYFTQANIVPQKITNTSNRTFMSGVNYDNDFGFDCSFLVTAPKTYKSEDLDFEYSGGIDIHSIKAENMAVEGTSIAVKKNKEED